MLYRYCPPTWTQSNSPLSTGWKCSIDAIHAAQAHTHGFKLRLLAADIYIVSRMGGGSDLQTAGKCNRYRVSSGRDIVPACCSLARSTISGCSRANIAEFALSCTRAQWSTVLCYCIIWWQEWWCGVYSGKHSAHGQLRGGRTRIKSDADLDPCQRRGTRWHPPSSIAFLSALSLHEPENEGKCIILIFLLNFSSWDLDDCDILLRML